MPTWLFFRIIYSRYATLGKVAASKKCNMGISTERKVLRNSLGTYKKRNSQGIHVAFWDHGQIVFFNEAKTLAKNQISHETTRSSACSGRWTWLIGRARACLGNFEEAQVAEVCFITRGKFI